MYQTPHGQITDTQAATIDELNHQIWENFWKIPREKRTVEDWEKLQEIQILIKK